MKGERWQQRGRKEKGRRKGGRCRKEWKDTERKVTRGDPRKEGKGKGSSRSMVQMEMAKTGGRQWQRKQWWKRMVKAKKVVEEVTGKVKVNEIQVLQSHMVRKEWLMT